MKNKMFVYFDPSDESICDLSSPQTSLPQTPTPTSLVMLPRSPTSPGADTETAATLSLELEAGTGLGTRAWMTAATPAILRADEAETVFMFL